MARREAYHDSRGRDGKTPRLVDETGNFTIISNVIGLKYARLIGPHALTVYVILKTRANPEGIAFPKITTLARDTGMGQTKVRESLKLLGEYGLLVRRPRFRDDGGQSSNDYALLTPPATPHRDTNPPPSRGVAHEQDPEEQGSEDSKESPGSDADSGDSYRGEEGKKDEGEKPLGMSWLAVLVDRVSEVDFQPTPQQKTIWGSGLKRYTTAPAGHEPPRHDEVMRVVSKIVEAASAGYFIGVDKALDRLGTGAAAKKGEDGSEPKRSGGSPDDVVAAVLEKSELRRYAPQLRRFDFSGSEEPPQSVVIALGGASDEQQRNLQRIRSIARRVVRSRAGGENMKGDGTADDTGRE